jgi:hypothetical protein
MTSLKIFYKQINEANNIIKNIVLPENYNSDKKKINYEKKTKSKTYKINKKALNIFKKNMKRVNEDFNIIKIHAQKTNYLLRKRTHHILGWNDIIEEYKHQLKINSDKKKINYKKKTKSKTDKINKKAFNIYKKNMKRVNEDFNIFKKHAWDTGGRKYHHVGWNDIITEYKQQLNTN